MRRLRRTHRCTGTRGPRPRRLLRLLLTLLAAPAAAGAQAQVPAPAPAQAPTPAVQVSAAAFPLATPGTEKAPRLAGDWLVCTRDAAFSGSLGTVIARDLATSTEHELGPGFLPDVDVYPAAQGGGAGVPPPGASGAQVVRVAWMRLHDDGRLSIQSAVLGGEGWKTAELAADVGCAGRLRVCGNYTAWTSAGEDGALAVQLHDGRDVTRPSTSGVNAFRPELARSESGAFALVWDEYRGPAAATLDYEICGSFRAPGGSWTEPADLSAAAGSLDQVATVAPAADGGWWIAWESDRGAALPRVLVAHRAPDGTLALPRPYPSAAGAAQRGLIELAPGAPTMRPVLGVDGAGRPWLIVENKVMGKATLAFDKRLLVTRYGESGWTEPVPLPGGILGEKSADVAAAGSSLRVVYQSNRLETLSLDVAQVELVPPAPPAVAALDLAPPPEPAPAVPHPVIRLPRERSLTVDGVAYRLLFADLHSHCGQSPDGVGELDRALFWARDQVGIDVWASTDHDETQREPMLDWEYELARRFVDHFDSPAFTTFMGFEWSNHVDSIGDEIIGHRATFSSRRCYRYVDECCDELGEYYAAMRAEDAIGIPHHLGKFGGSTFLELDPRVQPVAEITSGHGQFEDVLVSKLAGGTVRFGVTAAGDDHLGLPGSKGLAGIFCDTTLPRREAVKAGLRDRRCFGLVRHGLYADLRLDGRPMGSELRHAGELLLQVRVSELPLEGRGPAQPVHVNLSVNGDHAHPVWSRVVPPGGRLDHVAVLPGRPDTAFYMLRVTRGTQGTAPKDTLFWSSPIWVDAESAEDYPRATIAPLAAGAPATLPAGTPVTLELSAADPDGPADIVEASLHVTEDGVYTGTTPLPALAGATAATGATGATGATDATPATLSLPLGALAPGQWGFVLELRDAQGHVAVAGASLTVTP